MSTIKDLKERMRAAEHACEAIISDLQEEDVEVTKVTIISIDVTTREHEGREKYIFKVHIETKIV